jgi:uncharacterized membrane protein HdeD (DUF308 family)
VTDPYSSPAGAAGPPPGPAGLHEFLEAWWVPLVIGILNVIAALVILIEPHDSLLAIALVLGIYLAIAGALALALGFSGSSPRWGLIALAVLAVVAGAFVIARPGSAVHGVRIVFGIYLVVSGLAHLGLAASMSGDRRAEILRGVLEVIAGIVFLVAPKLGLAAVALFLGIYLLLRGALEIAAALALRQAKRALAP